MAACTNPGPWHSDLTAAQGVVSTSQRCLTTFGTSPPRAPPRCPSQVVPTTHHPPPSRAVTSARPPADQLASTPTRHSLWMLSRTHGSGLLPRVGSPGGRLVKNLPADAGHPGPTPGSGRSPGGGRGNPLQPSCLENPHGQRSLEGSRPKGRQESDTTGRLSSPTPSPLNQPPASPRQRLREHAFSFHIVVDALLFLRLQDTTSPAGQANRANHVLRFCLKSCTHTVSERARDN